MSQHRKNIQRLIAILLATVLALPLLSACATQETPPQAEPEPVIDPAPPIPEPDPLPKPEPEPDPDLFVPEGNINPLTGLCDGISDEALEKRPVGIMINNIITSLPQWGISKADIIYEMLAEGRITRFLALFQDTSGIEKLASVRSARPYYIDIAQSYGAVYIHFGGSVPAYEAIKNRKDLIHVDGIKGTWADVFFRDPERRKQMGLEHSVYTTAEYLDTILTRLESQGNDLHQEEHPSAFRFSDRLSVNSAMDGEIGNKVTLTFSAKHKPWFEYDGGSEKYLRFEYSEPQMDGWYDTQLAFDNVLVLRMDTTDIPSDLKLIDVNTIGRGEGYYFTKGKYIPIVWSKESYHSEILFFDENGEPLTVTRGKTFVSCVPRTSEVTIE